MSVDNIGIFICARCKQGKRKMKYLPCDIYCENCVEDMLQLTRLDTKEFSCYFCNELHLVPKNGFKDFQPKLKIDEVYRGESTEKLKSNLALIDSSLNSLKNRIDKSTDLILAHCFRLRNHVQVRAEALIKKIQSFSEEKFRDIKEYEDKYLLNSKMEEGMIEEIEKFKDQWSIYLDNLFIEETKVQNANNLSEDILKTIEGEKAKHDLLFSQGSVKILNTNRSELKKIVEIFFKELETFQLSPIEKNRNYESNVINNEVGDDWLRKTETPSDYMPESTSQSNSTPRNVCQFSSGSKPVLEMPTIKQEYIEGNSMNIGEINTIFKNNNFLIKTDGCFVPETDHTFGKKLSKRQKRRQKNNKPYSSSNRSVHPLDSYPQLQTQFGIKDSGNLNGKQSCHQQQSKVVSTEIKMNDHMPLENSASGVTYF